MRRSAVEAVEEIEEEEVGGRIKIEAAVTRGSGVPTTEIEAELQREMRIQIACPVEEEEIGVIILLRRGSLKKPQIGRGREKREEEMGRKRRKLARRHQDRDRTLAAEGLAEGMKRKAGKILVGFVNFCSVCIWLIM